MRRRQTDIGIPLKWQSILRPECEARNQIFSGLNSPLSAISGHSSNKLVIRIYNSVLDLSGTTS